MAGLHLTKEPTHSYALLISSLIIFNFAQSNRDNNKHALDEQRSECAIQVQVNSANVDVDVDVDDNQSENSRERKL